MSFCVFCHRGQLTKKLERISFRQLSDKGYVYCDVTVTVDVCDTCGMRTLDDTAVKVMDEAFETEYRKLTK